MDQVRYMWMQPMIVCVLLDEYIYRLICEYDLILTALCSLCEVNGLCILKHVRFWCSLRRYVMIMSLCKISLPYASWHGVTMELCSNVNLLSKFIVNIDLIVKIKKIESNTVPTWQLKEHNNRCFIVHINLPILASHRHPRINNMNEDNIIKGCQKS